MEQIQKVEEEFNFGDREIRTWFLIRHNYLPFILSVTYVLIATAVGPALMSNRRPFDLRRIMVIFNFLIVLAYVMSLTAYFWSLSKLSWEHFCKGCDVKKGHPSYMLIRSLWVIYLLKYIEFMDTIFFVLRKKNNLISFLHVFHHALTPVLGWVVGRLGRGGFQTIPIVINSLVHVVMYSYYGLAAMGPEYRKYIWWKKYLTQLQIIQFLVCIIFVGVVTPLSGCTELQGIFILKLIVAFTFLYLFCRFYEKSFKSETSQVKKPEEEQISDYRKLK